MSSLVLIDRDGTINVERNYLSSPEQVELFPQSADGIKLLRSLGLPVVVVTNQSAIGRGLFDLETLDSIHERLNDLLNEQGAAVDAIYFCPHLPEDNCDCRKPRAAMAEQAAKEFNANLSQSFLIGDNDCDIELGKNINATAILVRTGYGERVLSESKTKPDYVVDNLLEAACLIEKIISVPPAPTGGQSSLNPPRRRKRH
jgi:D-glycero-D-manno-heptose 1,7-bisphosphate phosphatase